MYISWTKRTIYLNFNVAGTPIVSHSQNVSLNVYNRYKKTTAEEKKKPSVGSEAVQRRVLRYWRTKQGHTKSKRNRRKHG